MSVAWAGFLLYRPCSSHVDVIDCGSDGLLEQEHYCWSLAPAQWDLISQGQLHNCLRPQSFDMPTASRQLVGLVCAAAMVSLTLHHLFPIYRYSVLAGW
jgi:hypothetical protein